MLATNDDSAKPNHQNPKVATTRIGVETSAADSLYMVISSQFGDVRNDNSCLPGHPRCMSAAEQRSVRRLRMKTNLDLRLLPSAPYYKKKQVSHAPCPVSELVCSLPEFPVRFRSDVT